MNRRHFIKQSALASSYFLVPKFLKSLENPAFMPDAGSYRNVVIIQFSGGNDGLNTIVPYRNDLYYKYRKSIALDKDKIIALEKDMGVNPAMQALKDVYDQGYLSIINNVGYPNPDRSHFRSMDIWQSASDSNQYISTGWAGRYLDSQCQNPYQGIEVDDNLSLAMKGQKLKGIAVKDPKKLFYETKDPYFQDVSKDISQDMLTEDNMGYLFKTMTETTSSAAYIYDTCKIYNNAFEYPNTDFSKELKTVATFIGSGLQTRVYYVSLGSFDTHVGQLQKQEGLLKQYSEGIAAFINNLKQLNKWDDTLIMTFSEFGRRVEQNASNGTDHGTAGNMFVMGSKLQQKGIINEVPDLGDLQDGDLKYHVDFRQVYATILDKWLQADSSKILGRPFVNLGFL